MTRIILGLIGIGIGFVIVWQSEWLLQNFGTNAWAEQKLGTDGGSRLLYKLIGIIIMFLALLYMTGLIEGILLAVFGRLFMVK